MDDQGTGILLAFIKQSNATACFKKIESNDTTRIESSARSKWRRQVYVNFNSMSRSRHKQKKDLWVRETRSGLVKHYEFYFAFISLFKVRKQIFTFTGVRPSLSIPSLPAMVPNFTGRQSECEGDYELRDFWIYSARVDLGFTWIRKNIGCN